MAPPQTIDWQRVWNFVAVKMHNAVTPEKREVPILSWKKWVEEAVEIEIRRILREKTVK